MTCAYCEIPEIKERTIVENNLAWAFPTNVPVVPGHTLICPKRCVSKLEDISAEELMAMLDLRLRLKIALAKAFNAEGFNYAWNEGEAAGQSVNHLHIHMLPRQRGDARKIGFDPRETLYRLSGDRKAISEVELQIIAKKIRSALA